MAKLSAIFELIDHMSDKLDAIADSGSDAVSQWTQAESAADAAFDAATEGAKNAAQAADGVANSLGDMSSGANDAAQAMEDAAGATDYWTDAVGNYDKEALEAIYTTEELVEMGFKTEEALEAEAAAAKDAEDALEDLEQQSEETGDAQEDAGDKGVDAFSGIASALAAAGITATVKEIAEAAYELAEAFSEAESTVVKATGASGDALDSLMESTMNAYAAAKSADLGTTAAAIGEINTRMGLTGDALTKTTGKFLDFAEITGTNVVSSVQSATKIMNKWGADSGDVESILDKLAYAGQVSGISVDNLASTVTNSSATFQSLGMDLDNTISLLASLELYGTNSATVVTGLRTAVNNFAKDGKDAETELQAVIDRIANMEDASEATALAVETFGSKAGQELAGAIRSGAISVDTLTQRLDSAKGTLTNTAKTAQTLDQQWTQANNNIKVAFTTAMEPTLSKISSGFASVVEGIGKFLQAHPNVTRALTVIGVAIGAVAIAFAAVSAAVGIYNAIMAISTAVTAAFGVTLSAAIWPITLVVAGIAALVAITAALIDAFGGANDETAGLTATSREQYYELQNLNDEYERACEEYGATSEEALRLKYQVDDLSAAFESGRQTLEEFTAEVDALCDSAHSVTESFNNALTEINANEVGALALIQKYEDLSTKTNRTAAEEKALEAVTRSLTDSYPELAARMDGATLSTEDYVEAMRKAAQAQADEARQQQAQDTYIDALQKRAELTEELEKAQANYNAELAAHNMVWNESIGDYDNGWYTASSPWASWTTDLDDYKSALDKVNAAIAENEDTISRIEQGWEDIAAAEREAEQATISYDEAVSTALASVQDDIDALCEAYDNAYESARSSIDGQIGLFDTMKTETETSVEDMQAAFQSQIEYLNTYTENLRKAAEYGLDEGLIASLSDGSTESAGYINAIIENIENLGAGTEAAQEFVEGFNSSFQEVEAAKDEFATTVATMETDFDEKMAEIEGRLDEAIDNMNMEADAAAAAKATMEAYTQAIRDGTASAISAAESASQAVARALSSTPTGNGYVPTSTVAGHASGTTNAEDVFMAGENGPELIVGKAGSTVFPAEETQKIISAVNGEDRDPGYYVPPAPFGAQDAGGTGEAGAGGERKVTLEIAGKGNIEVTGGKADKESLLEFLFENLKPVLSQILTQEIFEEGEASYEY